MPGRLGDPAPVGVAAVERGLDERRVGDRPRDPLGLLVARGLARPRARPTRVAPSPSATISSASCSSTASSSPSGSGAPGRAGRLQQHGVVGAHLAVDGDPLERARDRRRAGPRRGPRRTASVCTKQSMVAKPGSIIPAPFAWAETRDAAGAHRAALRAAVGGHDRLGEARAPPLGTQRAGRRVGRRRATASIGSGTPIVAGLGDRDRRGLEAERLGGGVAHRERVAVAPARRWRRWRCPS